jgi:hypothetical protein
MWNGCFNMSCWWICSMKMKDNFEVLGMSVKRKRRLSAITIWLRCGTRVTIRSSRQYASCKQDLSCRRWRGIEFCLFFCYVQGVFILSDNFRMKKKHMNFLSGKFNVWRRMCRVEQKDHHFSDMPWSHDLTVTPSNWCQSGANAVVLMQSCCFDALMDQWAW